MEPQNPQAQQPLQSGQYSPSEPPKRSFWPPSKRLLLLCGGIIAIIIILIFLLGGIGKDKKSANQPANLTPGSLNGPYYEREGYPRDKLGNGIGDALALELSRNSSSVSTNGAITYPACAVLTQTDIRQAGFKTRASASPAGVETKYIDGKGSGPVELSRFSLPSVDVNHCRYSLTDSQSVDLSIYQPFQVSDAAVSHELSRNYQPATIAGISGVEVYKLKSESRLASEDSLQYFVRKPGDFSFQLQATAKENPQALAEGLIKTILSGFDRLAKSPEGSPIASYKKSPPYETSYLRACDFLDDKGMQALAGVPAAAFVTERIANATGVIQYNSLKDDTLYLFVENECEREGASGGVGVSSTGSLTSNTPTMVLNTYSFKEAKGAENYLTSVTQNAKESVDVPNIGDGAAVVRSKTGTNQLLLRKGRFIVDMTYNPISQRGNLSNQQQYANTLLPYARYVVSKMSQN